MEGGDLSYLQVVIREALLLPIAQTLTQRNLLSFGFTDLTRVRRNRNGFRRMKIMIGFHRVELVR